ncbi:MAG TPA: pyridoxamine 5'-phosphate oxidase family protein [Candidatus Limnocylindria bacterium]|nr:pyridoxamine 5'-phosphate oxidase family protein [Candidatus Limnocylindria bacterium]
MRWWELEGTAPALAGRIRALLTRHRVAMLATLRANGSPRISVVEPYFVAGHLALGLMAWSAKARDLVRDPRCALHNPVTDPEGGDGEVRLTGRAAPLERSELRGEDRDAWWSKTPDAECMLVSLEVEAATVVSWDASGGLMHVERWTAVGGLQRSSRHYP